MNTLDIVSLCVRFRLNDVEALLDSYRQVAERRNSRRG